MKNCFNKMQDIKNKKCRIAIFASGEGSNAEAFARYFVNHASNTIHNLLNSILNFIDKVFNLFLCIIPKLFRFFHYTAH